ncbi:MAG: DUF4340 domain-containing protein [Spirochaetota bacterium]
MNKKTLASIGIIAGLILVIVLQQTVHFSSVPAVKPWKGEADEFSIKKGSSSEIRIYKKDGAWLVGAAGYPADASTVQILEKKMRDLSFSDFVTKKEFYERFDLTDDKAVHVTVKENGKVLRELLIGKKSPAGEQSYVRLPSEKEVYLAGGNLAFEFGREMDSFRDRRLMNATVDSISSVKVAYKGSSFVLKRRETKSSDGKSAADAEWVAEGSSADLDQNRVLEFLREFASVSADSFPAGPVKTGAVQSEIVLTDSAGKATALAIYGKAGKDAGGGYYCRSGENPAVLISAWKGEKLLKGLNDLKKK